MNELIEIHQRASAHRAAGNGARAMEELERAFRIAPGDVATLKLLAELADELGDYKKAKTMYRALLLQEFVVGPISRVEVQLALAEVHISCDEQGQARAIFERLIAQDPNCERAKAGLARLAPVPPPKRGSTWSSVWLWLKVVTAAAVLGAAYPLVVDRNRTWLVIFVLVVLVVVLVISVWVERERLSGAVSERDQGWFFLRAFLGSGLLLLFPTSKTFVIAGVAVLALSSVAAFVFGDYLFRPRPRSPVSGALRATVYGVGLLFILRANGCMPSIGHRTLAVDPRELPKPASVAHVVYRDGIAYSLECEARYVDSDQPARCRIVRLPFGGARESILAEGVDGDRIAVDGTHVYWSNTHSGTVVKGPIHPAGPTAVLASGQQRPSGIAVDGGHVYWTVEVRPYHRKLMRAPLLGGTPIAVVAADDFGEPFVLHGAHVYWSGRSGILRQATSGGPATLLVKGAGGADMAVHRTGLYWSSDDKLFRAPLDGGQAAEVSSRDPWPYERVPGFVVGDHALYWHERRELTGNRRKSSTHRLLKVASSGGEPEIIASAIPLWFEKDRPLCQLGVDGNQLYALDWGGQIARLTPR